MLALEALEIRIHERAGNFTGAVGAEVEEHHGIVRANHAVLIQHGGQNEFVGQVLAGFIDYFIGSANRLYGIVRLNAFAADHRVVRLFHAFPREIAIHGVETSHRGGDLAHADFLHLFNQLGHVLHTGIRRHVAAVQQGVYVYLFQTVALRHFQNAVQVFRVGMYAAGGYQTDQMQRGIMFFAVFHRRQHRLVFKENAILDILGDLYQHLIYHAARTDVGMANFAVAHLAVRQTYVQTGCTDGGRAVFFLQGVDVRGALSDDRVGLGIVFTDPKSIQNQKCASGHQ